MVWVVIPLACIAVLVVYLLVAPVVIQVDSAVGLYRIRFHRLASAAMRITESSLIIDMNIAGWKREIDLLEQKQKAQETEPVKQAKDRKRPVGKHRKVAFRKVLAILRSFKVKTCLVNLDTGDMPTNGFLYPVFFWLSVWTGKAFNINFMDENVIRLDIRNRVGRILWVYFRA